MHQVIVELAECWLFVIAAAQGTHLAVVASQEVDAEVMSVAMHTLVQQVGQKLTTPVRGEGAPAAPASFDAFASRNRG